MDETRLGEIEARAAAATPGELFVSDNEEGWRVDVVDDSQEFGAYVDGALIYGWRREDVELYVAARQDIPDLIAALRAAQARVAALEGLRTIVDEHALNLDIIKGLLVGIGSPLGPVVIQDILDALDKAKEGDRNPLDNGFPPAPAGWDYRTSTEWDGYPAGPTEEQEPVPDTDEIDLRTLDDLRGIASPLPAGMSSEKFVRRQREEGWDEDIPVERNATLTISTSCVCGGTVTLETPLLEGQAVGVKCDLCTRTYTLRWKHEPDLPQHWGTGAH